MPWPTLSDHLFIYIISVLSICITVMLCVHNSINCPLFWAAGAYPILHLPSLAVLDTCFHNYERIRTIFLMRLTVSEF